MIRVFFYRGTDKRSLFNRLVEAVPRPGDTVVTHDEAGSSRLTVASVTHVYENRAWYLDKAHAGEAEMGDRIVVELRPVEEGEDT